MATSQNRISGLQQQWASGAALLAIAVVKLWLVSGEEIIGSATQFDALWYVRSASHWYWGSEYNWTAFIRPCVYPLWLAAAHLLHLPQRLAIELLQLGGALLLCATFRSLGAPRGAALLSFAVIALHPISFQLNDYTMSDTLYAALLWWLLAGLLLTLTRRRAAIAAFPGVLAGLLWHTREEGMLLVVIVAVWACLLRPGADNGWRKPAQLLAVFLTSAVAVIVCFSAANYVRFHAFARSEMTARSFQSLYHSLLRIRPADPKPYAPITDSTLHRAFEVSPAFAELQPHLDSPLGEAWRVETFRRTGVPHEIGAGWIVWATRQAASEAGLFRNPRVAQAFFKKAARQINAACDDGRLPRRFVLDGFLDPLAQTGGLARLPNSAMRVSARVFARWPISAIPDDEILTAEETSLYDQMTLRRAHGSVHHSGPAAAVESLVGRFHFVFEIALHLLALAAAAFLIVRRGFALTGSLAVILLLAAAVLPRLALFAWLDATAFDATQDRFLFPVLPLWSALLVLVISHALQSWRSQRAEQVG